MNASKAWTVISLSLPISSPQLTAAAGNYAYVNLRLLGGIDVSVAPGRRHHCLFFFTMTYCTFFHPLVLGTLAPLGQASKFLFFSLESPMYVIASGCFYVNGLPLCLRPSSTPTACLYAYGLPSSSSSSYPCHRHRHHPFPVQSERLSFSFCDLYLFFSFLL